ncbi:MAG: hypothetical protein NTY19_14905 [Planctomycetota bacterium]|nr:hypothetical protein [Planctomycetota bacterium]
MQLVITSSGVVRCVYSEEIDLTALGSPVITRASHVEPDHQGRWSADLSPVGGPLLGPYRSRSEALDAERQWLDNHWLEDPTRQRGARQSESCPPGRDK